MKKSIARIEWIACVALCLALLTGLAASAESYSAGIMRLLRYEGSVTIEDAGGAPRFIMENARFNSGETLVTGPDGIAAVSLDTDRIVTVDTDSRVTFEQQSGAMKLTLAEGALLRWKTELISRIIPENRAIVRAAQEIVSDFVTDQDAYNWTKISGIRSYLAKDSIDEKSLFTLLTNALMGGDYATASGLQVEMYDKIEELKSLYDSYSKNMI